MMTKRKYDGNARRLRDRDIMGGLILCGSCGTWQRSMTARDCPKCGARIGRDRPTARIKKPSPAYMLAVRLDDNWCDLKTLIGMILPFNGGVMLTKPGLKQALRVTGLFDERITGKDHHLEFRSRVAYDMNENMEE